MLVLLHADIPKAFLKAATLTMWQTRESSRVQDFTGQSCYGLRRGAGGLQEIDADTQPDSTRDTSRNPPMGWALKASATQRSRFTSPAWRICTDYACAACLGGEFVLFMPEACRRGEIFVLIHACEARRHGEFVLILPVWQNLY